MSEVIDRLPPHDDKNEAALLAAVIVDPSCFDVVAGAEPWFYDLRHRTIFAALRELRENGDPIDEVTLYTRLRETGKEKDAGGVGYFGPLPQSDYSGPHVDYAIGKVRAKFIQRKLIAAASEIISKAYDESEDVADTLALFRQKMREADALMERREVRPAKAILRDCVDRYDKLLSGVEAGIQTGFLAIDQQGGFFPGELVLICGDTGGGKSTLALNLIRTALRSQPVALFSLEMADQAWMDRLISLDLQIDRRAFRSRSLMTNEVMQKLTANMARLGSLPLWVCDDSHSSIEDIRRVLKWLVERNGVKMVVIDYAQIVNPANQRDSREQQVAHIGRNARAIAQELGIVMILLSQLNDDGKVRESRALLHEAHLCITLKTRDQETWIACTKGRDMQFKDFPVDFDPVHCRLTQKSQFDRSYD